jgi:hypothetical protein
MGLACWLLGHEQTVRVTRARVRQLVCPRCDRVVQERPRMADPGPSCETTHARRIDRDTKVRKIRA